LLSNKPRQNNVPPIICSTTRQSFLLGAKFSLRNDSLAAGNAYTETLLARAPGSSPSETAPLDTRNAFLDTNNYKDKILTKAFAFMKVRVSGEDLYKDGEQSLRQPAIAIAAAALCVVVGAASRTPAIGAVAGFV
jgi:hypothetical protein